MNNKLEKIINKGFTPLVALRGFKNRPYVKWSDSNNHINKISDLKNAAGVTGFSLLTGEKSNIMVIDLDRHEGSADGVSYFKDHIEPKLNDDDLKIIHNTFTVKTPNNGLHLYFKYEEGLKTKANLFEGGIDIRTDGGLICAPYSIREGNRVYEPIDFTSEVLEMPQGLYELLYEECWKNRKIADTKISYKPVKCEIPLSKVKVNCYINYKALADTIKYEVSILDILSKYYGISINTASTINIPCPVHGGKKNNFAVYPDTNTAYCFSECNRVYNPISLVSEYYRVDYREALMIIANDFGIDVEQYKIEFKQTSNKAPEKVKNLFYDNYVSECKDEVIEAINKHSKILIDAPTGGGKTYAIVEIMNSFKDNLNIILTPNVIQNKQNAKIYSIQAFTGEDKNIYRNCISATYDKARTLIEYIKGKDLKVNLFIDECHLLIDASNYRMRAIKDIKELSGIVDKVIYMSATNEYTREILNHDVELNIKPRKAINNINEAQIVLFENKYAESSLIEKIIQCSNEDPDRKVILFLNNIETLNNIKTVLLKKGFEDKEIALINSKEKTEYDEKVFDNIIEVAEIPEQTKLILSTSTLEVGTNIKNENVTMIVYMPTPNHLDINSLIQKTARIRVNRDIQNNNKLFICMPYRNKEDNNIKDFSYVQEDLTRECKETTKVLMNCINIAYKEQEQDFKHQFLVNALNSEKKFYNLQSSVSLGVIELNEDATLNINEFKLQNRAKRFYESQFFYNIDELKKKLIKGISCNTWLNTVHFESERHKEEVKELSENRKENKKDKQEEIKEIFKRISELELNTLFIEKVFDENLNTGVCMIEEAFSLIEDTNIISLTKKAFDMSISPEEIIQSFIEHGDSIEKNKLQFKKCQFRMYNRAFQLGCGITLEKTPFKDYVMCRNKLDSICMKQGRLTYKVKLEIAMLLIKDRNIKNHKQYEVQSNMIYKKTKNKNDSSTPILKPLTKKQIDKIVMPIIESIYNLKADTNQLSSLRIK